jgi:membrane dipeptidase
MTESLSMDLHKRAVVVDAHVDTIQDAMGVDFYKTGKRTPRSLGERSTQGHVDIPRLLEGGVDVQIFAISAEPEYKPDRCTKRILQVLDHFYHELRENSQTLSLITRYSEIEEVVESGKVGAILSIEGGEAIEGDLAVLRVFYQLGVRAMTLTWSERNQIADGVWESRTQGGLTRLGVEVVKEMNRLGMIVDVSHLSETGFYDVMNICESPLIASHSNSRTICNHERNLTDEQMKIIASKGGVIGVCFAPPFVDKNEATLSRVLDHIDYMKNVIGVDHIGIGSDFDGIPDTPKGLEDVTKLPELTKGLIKRGYTSDKIEKILGGNFLRVFHQILK